MKFDKRDGFFVLIAAVVLVIFFSISGKEKTKPVPRDEMHKTVYEIAYKNAPGPNDSIFKRTFFRPAKKEAEKTCEPCHQQYKIEVPANHPPKNRCLLCHKLH